MTKFGQVQGYFPGGKFPIRKRRRWRRAAMWEKVPKDECRKQSKCPSPKWLGKCFFSPVGKALLYFRPKFSLGIMIVRFPDSLPTIKHTSTAQAFNLTLTSGVTDDGQGGEPPPGKLNVKTEPPFADILTFIILFVFIWLLLLCIFRRVFVFFSHFKHPGSLSFLNFFLSVG